MSQRALKKKDLLNVTNKQEKETTHQIYRKQTQPFTPYKYYKTAQRSTLSKNANANASDVNNKCDNIIEINNFAASKRQFFSTPNLSTQNNSNNNNSLTEQSDGRIQRAQSDSNLNAVQEPNSSMVNAKSEFHLKSIASTVVPLQEQLSIRSNQKHINSTTKKSSVEHSSFNEPRTMQSKRLSIHSGVSSNTAFSVTSSASDSTQPPTSGFADSENIRIPIVGYEVMEERARFTVRIHHLLMIILIILMIIFLFSFRQVYKLRVENPFTNDCWLVLRRYTDFQRLNNKLKSTFPQLPPLILPRKKLFGDNFSSLFLSNRVQGLQMFINTIMANEMLRNSQIVRDFFCLDEPPTYSESMEECRAIFEAQEETIAHLKMQLRAKDDVIMTLQQQLSNEMEQNRTLSSAIK